MNRRDDVVSELTGILLRLDGFRDEQTREVILDELVEGTGERFVVEGDGLGEQARSLVLTCARHPDVLPVLAALLRDFHGDTPETNRFADLALQLDVPPSLLTRREREELHEFLRLWENDSWRGAFALAASLVPEPPRDLAHAVELLKELAVPLGSVPPLVRFVWALADRSAPGERGRMLRWAAGIAERLEIPPARLWDIPRSRPSDGDERVVLVVRIQPYLPGLSKYLLSVWLGHAPGGWLPLAHEDDPLTLDQISARMDDFVSTARGYHQAGPSRVEFMLPRDLMNLPVDTWSVRRHPGGPRVALGQLHSVVLRDLERQQDPALSALWREKWARLAWHRGGPITPLMLYASRPNGHNGHNGHDDRELAVRLESATAVLVGGTSSWHEHGTAVPPELDLALDAGVPVMVWHRRGDAETDRFLRSLALKLDASQEITRLPDSVRGWRKEAADTPGEDFHASRMALLWDDPDHTPVNPRDFRSLL
ncbi:hypothetical protein ABZZ79_36470 [Streptomyces sp. NPDC006458]|uniref:VMAP-C domain-containing protein n=1 Tax=Streptomyces sp. NPDC006458 TaxID=3154302 RepID=UPI0033ACA9E7